MHTLKTGSFALQLEEHVFEEDMAYSSNTLVEVAVSSYDFSCRAQMDVDGKELAVFARKLLAMYTTLTGTAKLQEPYGYQAYIAFEAKTGGHIQVSGRLYSDGKDGYSQTLTFENGIDQTDLGPFAQRLYKEYSPYLPG